MAPPRGSAAYKKKDGTLALSKDSRSVSWTPVAPPGSKPALTLAVSSITNLQQTPASSAKVMLKIFALAPGSSEPETHVFSFTSPATARAEADAIKDALSKIIQSAKAGGGALAAPGGGSSSAAMAIASAVSSAPQANRDAMGLYVDERLKSDVELQQSLLKASPALSKTFMESIRTKPDAITSSQFTVQFWSTRIHLLRAHALEKNQSRGAYNVLSSVKPVTVDGTMRLTISKEQIQLIFNQHSLVKRVYDENVPKLSENSFWERFFQSRLFKKLKGEKISEGDPTDPTLDKYLQYDEDAERAKRLMASHVPHIIDIEGNEENHSQRKGNAPDLTMRPASMDRVPIIRTLNALSEKIMSHVAPNDIDPSLPIGVDEETFNSLALQDLRGDAEAKPINLDIRDQSHFLTSDKQSSVSTDALLYARQDPTHVLSLLRSDLSAATTPDLNLDSAIGVNPDTDSDSDPGSDTEPPAANSSKNPQHVGSHRALTAATSQILSSISLLSLPTPSSSSTNPLTHGLPPPIYDRLTLTHATTTEFLTHFYSAFLSGLPSRADELFHLVPTLNRAMDRINAVAADADAERDKEVEKVKRQIREREERTGRKVRFDFGSIGGGGGVVKELLSPTVKAIERAVGAYRGALGEGGEGEALGNRNTNGTGN